MRRLTAHEVERRHPGTTVLKHARGDWHAYQGGRTVAVGRTLALLNATLEALKSAEKC